MKDSPFVTQRSDILMFAIAGLVMFSSMTYFAPLYGVLGLFSKSLCVVILLAALTATATSWTAINRQFVK